MPSHAFSQVLVPASTYDLIDLPTVKDELSLKSVDTSNDNFLNRAITQSSAAAANYCNRIFQVETLIDTVDFERDSFRRQMHGGARDLRLARWPVVAIISLTECDVALTEGVDFLVDYDSGILYRLSVITGQIVQWPALTVVVNYQAGFTARAAQTDPIPGAPGPYTISVTNASAFILDKGVVKADGTAMVPVALAPAAGQYMVNAGIYTFNAADTGASVTANYAFAQVPADVVDAVLRLITMRFKARGRDPMLVSQTLPNVGETRYWVGPQSGQAGGFPQEISSLLDNYRVPVVA